MKKFIAGMFFYGWYAICVVYAAIVIGLGVYAVRVAYESPQNETRQMVSGVTLVAVLFVMTLPITCRIWDWAKKTLGK